MDQYQQDLVRNTEKLYAKVHRLLDVTRKGDLGIDLLPAYKDLKTAIHNLDTTYKIFLTRSFKPYQVKED